MVRTFSVKIQDTIDGSNCLEMKKSANHSHVFTKNQISVLRIIWEMGSCTPARVHKILLKPVPLVAILRIMHELADKNILVRTDREGDGYFRVNEGKLSMVKVLVNFNGCAN